jgi:hypothetical protein
MWVMFWLSAVAGLAFTRNRNMTWAFAPVPLSAFAAAGIGLVPLYQRFALYTAPVLYLGMALLIDRAIRMGRDAHQRRRWSRLILPAAILLVELQLCTDIIRQGVNDVQAREANHKQQFDDRTSVRWLMRRTQPGDAVLTTHLGWPAIWWYGEIPIGEAMPGRAHPAGFAAYEVGYIENARDCLRDQLADVLKDHGRVLVYLGFRDVPEGFDDLLLHRLAELGAVSAYREFTAISRAAIVDLHVPRTNSLTHDLLARTTPVNKAPLAGCIGVEPARRW